jgi:hypothetical protein
MKNKGKDGRKAGKKEREKEINKGGRVFLTS